MDIETPIPLSEAVEMYPEFHEISEALAVSCVVQPHHSVRKTSYDSLRHLLSRDEDFRDVSIDVADNQIFLRIEYMQGVKSFYVRDVPETFNGQPTRVHLDYRSD